MNHNYLWHIPGRFGLLSEILILGNFTELPTVVRKREDQLLHIQLPDLTTEPKLVLEHHFIFDSTHPLWNWPDQVAGWYPMNEKGTDALRKWLFMRFIQLPPTIQVRTRQLVVAPIISMQGVINEIEDLLDNATKLAVSFENSKEVIAHVLRPN